MNDEDLFLWLHLKSRKKGLLYHKLLPTPLLRYGISYFDTTVRAVLLILTVKLFTAIVFLSPLSSSYHIKLFTAIVLKLFVFLCLREITSLL